MYARVDLYIWAFLQYDNDSDNGVHTDLMNAHNEQHTIHHTCTHVYMVSSADIAKNEHCNSSQMHALNQQAGNPNYHQVYVIRHVINDFTVMNEKNSTRKIIDLSSEISTNLLQ